MSKIRIVLADDHETVREGLKAILNRQSDMEVIAEAGDGDAAIAHAAALSPDLVVMDVSMPQRNGLQATAEVRKRSPQVKVLTLTRHADDGFVRQLMRAGASGYVLKQSCAADLLRAIRAVAAGDTYLDLAVRHSLEPKRRVPEPRAPADASGLSPREDEVLRLVAWGHSNKEIATRLDLSVKTVETHKANAMQKLSLRSRIDIVRFALLRGWLQET